MLEPRFAWHLPAPIDLDPALVAEGAERGVSERLVGILAGRGIDSVARSRVPRPGPCRSP